MSLLIFCSGRTITANGAGQGAAYGPETRSFLEYVGHELDELEFQIAHSEIDRKHYSHSKNKLFVLRDAVLDHVKTTGQDIVPEYSVASEAELGDFLQGGVADVKGKKPGDMIDKKWRFVGTRIKVEKFYVLERVASY